MVPDTEWLLPLAQSEQNAAALDILLDVAIDRNREDVIASIEQKLPSLQEFDRWSGVTLFWLPFKFELYKFRQQIISGIDQDIEADTHEIPTLLDDPELKEIKFQVEMKLITNQQAEEMKERVFEQRRLLLRQVIAAAVSRRDAQLLENYNNQLNDPEFIRQIVASRLGITGLGYESSKEAGIVKLAVDYLCELQEPSVMQKPASEINNVQEVVRELIKATRRHFVKEETVKGIGTIQTRVPATSDRVYWLAMRLGELEGGVEELKNILQNPNDARLEVLQEAVRCLLIANELDFLRGLVTEVPQISFWETESKADVPDPDYSAAWKKVMTRSAVAYELPWYIKAIVEEDE